jgi:hypothetical protein
MQWKTNSKWVDLETGEALTEEIARRKYVIVKKIKKTTYNATTARGTIEITNECRESRQQTIW